MGASVRGAPAPSGTQIATQVFMATKCNSLFIVKMIKHYYFVEMKHLVLWYANLVCF
jgi:hypothetical protein